MIQAPIGHLVCIVSYFDLCSNKLKSTLLQIPNVLTPEAEKNWMRFYYNIPFQHAHY